MVTHMRPSNHGRRPGGQFAVMFALVVVSLIGAIALTTDVAVIYYQYVQLQAGTDSSALAGANYLPNQISDATTAAQTVALANGIQASEIKSITVASGGASITVSTTRIVPAIFSKVLGLSQFAVNATAVAASQPAGSVAGVIPVGLDSRTPYTMGQTITMHQGGTSYGPGNWGGLALGGTGASVFRNNLENGYSSAVNVNDLLQTEPGATVGPTEAGVNYRLNTGASFDSSATWSEHQLNDPRAVTVPLVNWANINGSSQVPVVGFAEIWLTGVSGTDITAIFIAQGVDGNAVPGAPNGGAFHVALIQ